MRGPSALRRRGLWLPVVLLGAWAVVALIALTSPFTALDRLWHDAGLRWTAPKGDARAVLVVDIDEETLRGWAAQGQPWPVSREVHAQAVQRLFELGARAVVINLLFADPRPGDDALAKLAGQIGHPLVLAADVSNEVRPPLSAEARARAAQLAWAAPATQAAATWSGLVLPSATLLEQAQRLGVQRAALDADGQLRCLHLLHRVEGLALPTLAVAALNAASEQPAPPDKAAAVLQARWRGSNDGCVTPRIAAHAGAVPGISFGELMAASPSVRLADQVRGRTVFVGSPSVLDARAMTPLGQVAGTWWQALAFEALNNGQVMAPPRWWIDGGLLALASLPLLLGLVRREPDWLQDLRTSAVVAGLLLALAFTLLWWQQAVALPAGLLVLAAGLAPLGWRAQRHLAEQRQQALLERTAALAAERATSEFVAHMSHEIRTPLNAMLGVAQLLGETPLTPLQRRYVETFGHAGTHLTRLVDDVLDLSRLEADGVRIERAPFRLQDLADEARALFDPMALSRSLQFSVQLAPACPAWVLGDAHRVRQVLINLLGNAMKFTPRGSVQLEVQPAAESPGLDFVVRDTGIGIAAERLPSLFEPFTQADDSVARRFGGSGLGLAITRRLVQALGGRITLESAPGLGTTARVWLPLPACERPAPPPPLTAEAKAPPPTALIGRRLLLAEDNEVNVMVVQGMLHDSGVRLDVARDGREAVRMAACADYDLILMDLLMPQLDGHQATREIRAEEARHARPPVPVVALSANTQAADVQASLAAGCVAHLGKPVDKATLLAALRTHLSPMRGRSTPPAPLQPPRDGDAAASSAAQPRPGG